MPVEQIMNGPENGRPAVPLPGCPPGSGKVKAVIDEVDDEREAGVAFLQQAANDPLSPAGREAVRRNFEGTESKTEE